ncbi:hypothetical protein DCS_00454 [Drechmeria coniospora]|uniref:Uncharacterized protein n=1 Tax=Drechmeria coniospora TaxID=98403 RepID=A0A151GQC5_DRECN|nr:hypothetical protein DCS_00454 [Drechmeria coniospora]KYK59324.1 hypothetical protein DCS_00454 [Drechmeria coniospora]ODA77705.1 hypothetical protein RJ55_06307 [Drechmeria coniospora]
MEDNVKMLYSRVQTLLQRRRKQKRALQISAPFDLKLEPVSLPGVSEDEISMLREKAVASRLGVYETMSPRNRTLNVHKISRPKRPTLPTYPAMTARSAW